MRRKKWSRRRGREQVALNSRTRTILCGSSVNFVAAVLLVSSLLKIWSVLTSRDPKDFAMFPWWMWALVFFVGPFAFFTGLIGMALLTRVRPRLPTRGRYLAEATALGALLGASYPAVAAVLHLDGLVSWKFFGLGVVSRAVCGSVGGYVSMRRVLGAKPPDTHLL